MSNTNNCSPIGNILRNAGLTTQGQVQKHLDSQKQLPHIKLGEFLTIQNEIKVETVDFFVNKWGTVVQKGHQFPIGYYFQQAFLLSHQQIQEILAEQKDNNLKFGDIAVAKNWLSLKTVDFFLNNLSVNQSQLLSLNSLEKYNQNQLHLEHKYSDTSMILARIIAWTAGHPSLSIDICQTLAESDVNCSTLKAYQIVDQLVENAVIKNWSNNKLGRSIRFIKTDLNNNQKYSPLKLWQEYRDVLLSDNKRYQKTGEQDELLHLGLLVKEENKLQVTNLIFSHVFDHDFIAKQIKQQHEKPKINNKLKTKKSHLNNATFKIKSNVAQKKENQTSKVNTNKKLEKSCSQKRNLFLFKTSKISLLSLLLLIPAFVFANNFFSIAIRNESTSLLNNEADILRQSCEMINISDSSSRLNSIFRLEQKKKQLLAANPSKSSTFPYICEATLNKMRMLAIPDLGRDNSVIEAMSFLCSVPPDSESVTEAKVWLKRWYYSPTWDKATKSYLKETSECPAGKNLM